MTNTDSLAHFTAAPRGPFMERFGPLGREADYSPKKLCLVATDLALLQETLYVLSLRRDCYYVKYGTGARDGMYLGRCFLETGPAAGELCKALKGHPRLMVALQDDDFFESFRKAPIGTGDVGVRDEKPADATAIVDINTAAFEQPLEAGVVDAVRAAGQATVSLVAQLARPEGGTADREATPWPIVGHILLSPVTIDGRDEVRGLGLAPMAVLPAHQRNGVGTRLVEAALERARMLGYRFVVVLGHPEYYPRFGFQPASSHGLRYEQPVPDEAFMALELTPGALSAVQGIVRYLPAFAYQAR